MSGADVCGIAQTGTGKTAAFAIPMLQILSKPSEVLYTNQRPIRALILTPTRELAIQIQESFNAYMNSILKYYELKEVEKANEYNENTYKNEEEEDVLFGNCDSDSEKDETTPVMKSFWGKERVVKKTTKLSAFDLGMFPQKNF
jgi:ATP-dependent helicase YprA (DUF1998 family)